MNINQVPLSVAKEAIELEIQKATTQDEKDMLNYHLSVISRAEWEERRRKYGAGNIEPYEINSRKPDDDIEDDEDWVKIK